jgi:tRNA(Arg) A34 adenosine deaminase TadA
VSDKTLDRATMAELRRIAHALERIAAALEKLNTDPMGRVVVKEVKE